MVIETDVVMPQPPEGWPSYDDPLVQAIAADLLGPDGPTDYWHAAEVTNRATALGIAVRAVHVMEQRSYGREPWSLLSDGQHRHYYDGQSLIHEHVGGESPHGYYEHDEDPRPRQPTLGAELAAAVAAERDDREVVTTVGGPMPGPEPTLRDRIGALRYYGERYAEARADWHSAVSELEAAAADAQVQPDRYADGGLRVSPTVADALTALAADLQQTVKAVVLQVSEQKGDYLTAVADLDDYAAQMQLLATGSWGAGTPQPGRG